MDRNNGSMRRVLLWSVGIAVAALVIAGVLGWVTGAYRGSTFGSAERISVDEQRSIDVSAAERVKLSAVSAAINLREVAGSEVTLHLHGSVMTTDRKAVPQLESSVDGGTVSVKVVHKPLMVIGFRSTDLTLDVGLPKNFGKSLEVSTVSGPVDLSGNTFTALTADTTSGRVHLSNVSSRRVSLRSVSGRLQGEKLMTESINAESTSGRIELGTSASNLDLRSVSGQVGVVTSSTPKQVRVESTSGQVALQLPSDSAFALDAESTSGRVSCDFPVVMTGSAGRNQVVGKVGNAGRAEVHIRTTSGGIHIGRE